MRRGHHGPAGMQPGRSCRDPVRRRIARRSAGMALAVALGVAGGQGGAGHSVGHYPSYYPDEIRIDVVDPAAAGKGLAGETLHAYVNATPDFAGPVPGHVKSVQSLGSFLILSFDTATARFASAEARCAAARSILAALREEKAGRLRFPPLSRDALSRRLPASPRSRRGSKERRVCVCCTPEGRRKGPACRGNCPGAGAGGRWRRTLSWKWCRSMICSPPMACNSTAGRGRRG